MVGFCTWLGFWLVTGWTTEVRMAGILAWVLAWWMANPIPLSITGLWGVVLTVLLGVVDPATAFSGFSHKVSLLLLGTFMVAEAMKVHQTDRVLSLWILSRKCVQRSPVLALLAMVGLSGILSWWFSSTATLAMLAPIVAGIFSGPMAGRVLLALAYAAPLGGIAFPLGANPNILCMALLEQQAGIHMSFSDWMKPGLLVSGLAITGMLALLFLFKKEKLEVSATSRIEFRPVHFNVLAALVLLAILWIVPSVWKHFQLHESIAALAVACLLFVLPYREGKNHWRPTLTWEEAKELDWSIILLVATGISLGAAIFQSGLAMQLGLLASGVLGSNPSYLAVAALVMAVTFLITLVTSNTATGELMLPIAISIAQATHQNPAAIAMGVAMIASLGVTIPAATPPVAIVSNYASVKQEPLYRLGFATDFLGVIVVFLVTVAWGVLS